jgi:hypothetical protein
MYVMLDISELGFLVVRSSTADEKENEGAVSAWASASFLLFDEQLEGFRVVATA